MNKPCKVSVVIPCFNQGEFLPEAIRSATAFERNDIESIIVDDGSTDERTRQEMDTLLAKGITVIRQGNKGLAAARNAGIAISRGEYILPLDADNRLRSGYIEHGIRILDAHPRVGVVYGDAEYIGLRTGRWRVGSFERDRLLLWNYIDACAMFRRCIWEQNGGYDGTMPVQGYEDWDFWLGALEHGWEFAYVREVVFDYRVAEQSMITRTRKFESQIEAFIARKHGLLFRRRWQQQRRDHESLGGICRDIGRLLKSRSSGIYTVVRLKIAKELRLISQRFERRAS
jgi:glycosyltransferase involved in cell wall biosynthesis